eukprot:m.357923 g.357923  ORF g.357923 m.357923 type:complete len:508 (-) comp17988_c0_seq1:359-1882(-)
MSVARFSTQAPSWMGTRAENVGIKAMDIYFPSQYVSQHDLERHYGVSEGKYTIGLGQEAMAVCDPAEDINSACLTAVSNLMEKYNIPWSAIGRLEVGTESLVDKSKAVKTTLMDLFAQHGNTDIEGIDSKNACYGGTAAVFNSAAWIESSAWDGRYAIAVAGDIAVYEEGPARPTGGAGVIAMLIGPDAPLAMERVRATHMENVWDFYKPTMDSEYPRVDGHLSNECYLRSVDVCYNSYADKFQQWQDKAFTLEDQDYAIFHAPYNKLVQKSFGRFFLQDFLRKGDSIESLDKYRGIPLAETYNDRHLQKALSSYTKPIYNEKVQPSELITKQCGNSYCGSLYAGLLSLIANKADTLQDKRIMMFSYGSGLAASLFSLKVRDDVTFIRDTANVKERLEARTCISPEAFERSLQTREDQYTKYDFKPEAQVDSMFKGTYYLNQIDGLERRYYSRSMHTMSAPLAASLASTSTVAPVRRAVFPRVAATAGAARASSMLRGFARVRSLLK